MRGKESGSLMTELSLWTNQIEVWSTSGLPATWENKFLCPLSQFESEILLCAKPHCIHLPLLYNKLLKISSLKQPLFIITVSSGQKSRHSFARFSAWGLTKLKSRYWQGHVLFWWLDWGRTCFQASSVVGRTHFLEAVEFMAAWFLQPVPERVSDLQALFQVSPPRTILLLINSESTN